jgi:hypothetical protein
LPVNSEKLERVKMEGHYKNGKNRKLRRRLAFRPLKKTHYRPSIYCRIVGCAGAIRKLDVSPVLVVFRQLEALSLDIPRNFFGERTRAVQT